MTKDEHSRGTGDGHSRAALLLTESLIHALVARSALSVAEAIEIVETAGEAADAEDLRGARALLAPIARSLSYDLS